MTNKQLLGLADSFIGDIKTAKDENIIATAQAACLLVLARNSENAVTEKTYLEQLRAQFLRPYMYFGAPIDPTRVIAEIDRLLTHPPTKGTHIFSAEADDGG